MGLGFDEGYPRNNPVSFSISTYEEAKSLLFVRVTANTPVRVMREASLKIVGVLKIRARAPAVIAPRAEPTLNIVDR